MKKVKTKSLDYFLKEIEELKSKASELNKFEDNPVIKFDSLSISKLKSNEFLKNSQACTKIVDLDFNLQYMSDVGIELLKINDITDFYGKRYPLNFYPDTFKIPMQECLEKVKSTKKSALHEGFVINKENETIWFQSTLIPINDNQGNLDHIMIVALNISNQKRIEQEILQSQEFNESLLNTTPDIIYVYDLIENKNVYNNNGNFQLLGYTMEEIRSLGSDLLSEIIHPDDYKYYVTSILHKYDKLKDGEIIESEYRAKHKNGDWVWLHSRESIFKREDGKPTQVIGISGDITQRKKIELDLKQSKDKLNEALEITKLATFSFDDYTNLFETSKIGNEILGIDKSYVKDIQGWINLVHPDDLNNVQDLLDDPSSNYATLEFRIIRPSSKKTIWISGYAKKEFDINGQRTEITGTFQDVSERKEAEEKLHKAQSNLKKTFDISPSIISKANLKTGFFVDVSPAIKRILGYTKKEFLSKPFIEFIHPDDLQRTINEIEEKLKGGNTVISFENRYLCKDGSYKWMDWQSTAPDENGIVTSVGSNIQDKKVIENDLKLSAERFERWKSSNFIGVIQAKSNGDVIDVNNTFLNMVGYTRHDMETGEIDFKRITPREYSHLIDIGIKEAIEKGSCTPFEKEYYHKKGHRIPVLIGGSLLVGTEDEFIVFVIDLTENKKIEKSLKESEEFLNLTGELAKVGGWEVDLSTGNAKWSKETKSIHELEKNYQPNLDEAINFYHIDDREIVNKHVANAIENNEPFSFEARIITQKGNLKYVKAFGQPVFKSGQCIRLYGAFQDITEQKKIELELEEYRKELETQNVLLKKEMSLSFNFEDMVYSSSKMSAVLTMVEQVAKTDANVLILGETGTGKELIAKAIHKISNRKNNSLISVNCGAIPSELIESELFGHEKGAFTGAINNRLGKFELADGGTIFLDEIGEMPLSLQPKLLRAIQEGEIESIGGSTVKKVNVRIIAATNKNLKEEIKKKQFREDLYFRLNVFPINIPPLRDRIEDITVLTEFFVNKYSKKHNKHIEYISDVTMQQLKYYNWPGNVRELENLVERAIILSNSNILVIPEFETDSKNSTSIISGHRITLEQVQKDHILKTLNDTNWKIDGKDGAAELLDIKPSTLRDRMKKFGIKRP